ncbi:MAG: energy-coupling factor ABC transporter ATP-binding protein [Desulfovibrio sp.]|nr:energy-coupling factor ABC transporter ATP-binding protein [Desulfovibrio sp.]
MDKPSGDAIFALEGASFAYDSSQGTREVLKGLDFSLRPGQCIGLYGPNGSGKTTMLRCITGLSRLSAGRVLFHGAPVEDEAGFHKLRCAVGYVLQNADDQLFFPTVLEDVAFGPLNLGMGADEARDCALDTLKSLGMASFADRLTHRLSGGEKKMASLAAVLAMKPEALLLDEPTGGLDMASQERLCGLLKSLDVARVTISHDWDFLAEVSDRFCTIQNKAISWTAPLEPHVHRHAHPGGGSPHSHG